MKKILLSILFIGFLHVANAQYVTLYTPYGQTIQGLTLTELTQSQIDYMDSIYTVTYPYATFLGSSTRSYNCHSYAWHMQKGGSPYWINSALDPSDPDTAVTNIGKYWTSDYYVPISVSSQAQIIHYYRSDHSAIASPTVANAYESKWGSAPLMRHAPEYGPYYFMSYRHYYAARAFSFQISGDDVVTVGESKQYEVALPAGISMTCEWTVLDAKGEESGYTQTISGNINTITFNKASFFQIYCKVYSQWGVCVADLGIEIISSI